MIPKNHLLTQLWLMLRAQHWHHCSCTISAKFNTGKKRQKLSWLCEPLKTLCVWPMDHILRTTDLVVLLHEEHNAQKSCAISQIAPLQNIYVHPFRRRIRVGWEFPTHCSFCYIAHNFFFLWGRGRPVSQHAGSQFTNQGSHPCPLQWKQGVLTTGQPGKSLLHSI